MVYQIRAFIAAGGEPYHRWFGGGDLQNVKMLRAIVRVAELTPEIFHWLPTRESAIVRQWLKEGGKRPSNLNIRISSTMVDDKPVASATRADGINTSTVHTPGREYVGHECPKYSEAHRAVYAKHRPNCASCRMCWDSSVPNVSDAFHH